jgi:hypothetical protein
MWLEEALLDAGIARLRPVAPFNASAAWWQLQITIGGEP